MRDRIVTIFGGSGFIGRYVVQKLVETGSQIRVAVRNPDTTQFLKPLGQVGQIITLRVDINDKNSVKEAINSAQTVINLIGILSESGNQTFYSVHVKVPKLIAQTAKEQNVSQLIHISALGATPKSRSKYATSKGLGEQRLRTYFPSAIILRPSVVFGPEDKFLNLFAQLAKYSPVLPLIGGGHTKLQPVYVGDIAEVIARLVTTHCQSKSTQFSGKIFELAGPKIYTWKQVWQFVVKQIACKRLFMPIPYACASAIGALLQFFPQPLITPDQVKLMAMDNVASGKLLTMDDLDIEPTSMETLAPTYLRRYRYYG